MTRTQRRRLSRLLASSALRLAVGCLLAAISLPAGSAAPSIGLVVSSESELPLESDETSPEAALPGCDEHQAGRLFRASGAKLLQGDRRPSGVGSTGRYQGVIGHRLANGLRAPLRC